MKVFPPGFRGCLSARSLPVAALACLIAIGSGLPSVPALGQTDDFESGTDNLWGRYNPIGVGAWNVVNHAYRMQTAPSPNPTLFGPGRAGSLFNDVGYGDYFYLSVDLVNWNDSLRQSVGLLARVESPGPGTTTGYAFTWDRGSSATSGDVDMNRIDGEVPHAIAPDGGGDAIHFVLGRSYRMVFIGKGSSMEGRVYELPDTTTPVATLMGSDGAYTTGQVGLVVFANTGTGSTDATFDNFSAADVEPPRINVDRVFSDLYLFSWPAVPVSYALEYASTLPAAAQDWTEIVDIARLGDNDTYALEVGPTATLPAPKFFRLRRR